MNGEKIRWLVLSASYDSSFDTTTSETPYQRLLWELVAIADLRELALAYDRGRYCSHFESAIARVATPRLMTSSSNAAKPSTMPCGSVPLNRKRSSAIVSIP
jgi:hypothetical protein